MNKKTVRKIGCVLFAGLCLSILCGCAAKRLHYYEPGDTIPGKVSIKKCVDRWSRHLQKHDRWATVLDVDAIFLSWEVRHTILERTLSDRDIDAETAEAMREREKQIFDGYVEFYLAVMTTKVEWNDLAEEEATWNLVLVTEGQEFPSFRVEEVELDPALKFVHFPMQSNFKKFYKVSFIRKPGDRELPLVHKGTKSFDLLFKGFFGPARLTWKLD